MKKAILALLSTATLFAQSAPTTVTKYGYGDSHGQNVIANGPLIFGPSSPGTVASGSTFTVSSGATFDFSAGTVVFPSTVVLTTGSYANPGWITSLAYSKLTGLPSPVVSLTGDGTASVTLNALGSGTGAFTLANTAVTPTTYGDSSHVAQVVVDSKGRITGASSVAISGAGLGALLAANNLADVANAGTSRTNLGLAIGTNVQAWNANLDTWAGKTPYAGMLAVTSGKTVNFPNTTTITSADGATVAAGAGGTLGKYAYSAGPYYDVADYASLAAAVSAIGATSATLRISTPVSLATNVTTPLTMTLEMSPGGVITTTGHTLTINGHLNAGEYQIFSGSGTVSFGRNTISRVNALWFGAKGDPTSYSGGFDNSTAFQAAMDAAAAAGVPMFIPSGQYKYSTTLTLWSNVILPGAAELDGVQPSMGFGAWYTTDTTGVSTQLVYTGSTVAIATGMGSTITIKNLVLTGPGRTTAGSIGIGVSSGSSNSLISTCKVQAFESDLVFGYNGSLNADFNYVTDCYFNNCYNGIYIKGSQSVGTSLINNVVFARIAVNSTGPYFNVIGGEYTAEYLTLNTESIWSDTVSNVSGQLVTLNSGINLAVGMTICVQGNSQGNGAAIPPYSNPIGTVTHVSGSTATVSGYVGSVVNGANVIYGWPAIIFKTSTNGAGISGVHCEPAPDLNNLSVYYAPTLVYNEGVQAVTIDTLTFNDAANSNILYNKLFPLIYDAPGAGPIEIRNSSFDMNYPKIEYGSTQRLRLENNFWQVNPILINNTGYYPTNSTEIKNDVFAYNWGQLSGNSLGIQSINPVTAFGVFQAPQDTNTVLWYDGSTPPAGGIAGEYVQSTGPNARNFMGWKQSRDDGFRSYFYTASPTATGSMTSGSTLCTVTDATQFRQYEAVSVAGAGVAGAALATRIEFIDGGTNILYLDSAASTTVSGAAIAAVAPVYYKAGEVFIEGSTTWDPANHATLTQETKTLTVTGAALGDAVEVFPPYDLQGITAVGYVQAADTAAITIFNGTSGAINLGSGAWKVRVIKQ